MNEDKIIEKLMEHDERLERIEKTMATKDHMKKIMDVLDVLVLSVKKIQEDHTFVVELYKKVQAELEEQKADIKQIKLKLAMA